MIRTSSHTAAAWAVYSFNHSTRDELRAVACPKEIIDQIGGWSSSDVGESYGKGHSFATLANWLARIEH